MHNDEDQGIAKKIDGEEMIEQVCVNRSRHPDKTFLRVQLLIFANLAYRGVGAEFSKGWCRPPTDEVRRVKITRHLSPLFGAIAV